MTSKQQQLREQQLAELEAANCRVYTCERLRLHNLPPQPAPLQRIGSAGAAACAVAVAAADGEEYIASASRHVVDIFHALDGRRLCALPHDRTIDAVALSPEFVVYIMRVFDTSYVFQYALGKTVAYREVRARHCFHSVEYSPDFQHMVFAASYAETEAEERDADRLNAVVIWDACTFQPLQLCLGHTGPVAHACFSANGRNVLSSSQDRTVKLWTKDTGECLRTYLGHKQPVLCCAQSPDAKLIASGALNQVILVHDTKTGAALVAIFCVRALSMLFRVDGSLICGGDCFVRVWPAVVEKPAEAIILCTEKSVGLFSFLSFAVFSGVNLVPRFLVFFCSAERSHYAIASNCSRGYD
eukprot:m.32851 g.32851  ORF g.32851 m.32851 type:complete len:357 (-) comp12783_c0_seq2:92-1162(-)